jgi:hypothetical protein
MARWEATRLQKGDDGDDDDDDDEVKIFFPHDIFSTRIQDHSSKGKKEKELKKEKKKREKGKRGRKRKRKFTIVETGIYTPPSRNKKTSPKKTRTRKRISPWNRKRRERTTSRSLSPI